MAVRYDQETKDKAIKLSDEIGIKAAAEQLGLSEKTIWYFRSARKKTEKKLAEAKRKYIIEPPDPEKEVEDNPYVSFTKSDDERIFKRGEIYYIHNIPVIGCEQTQGRPGIIVSNDTLNKHLGVVTVVFLTSKKKDAYETRVPIYSSGRPAMALAEQINTVDKSRIGNFVGECTPAEIDAVDNAIITVLNLERHTAKCMSDDQIIARMTAIKAERDAYERQFDKLLSRFIKMGGGEIKL